MPSPPRPWHRVPGTGQTEVCSVCGSLINNTDMIEPDVEGLRGFTVCNNHPYMSAAAVTPSFNDCRSSWGSPEAYLSEREPPIGEEFWFDDPIGGPGEGFEG